MDRRRRATVELERHPVIHDCPQIVAARNHPAEQQAPPQENRIRNSPHHDGEPVMIAGPKKGDSPEDLT